MTSRAARSDTSPDAAQVQLRLLRQKSPTERAAMAWRHYLRRWAKELGVADLLESLLAELDNIEQAGGNSIGSRTKM